MKWLDPTDAAAWLVNITLVATAALLISSMFRHRAAMRHALLVSALLLIALSPLSVWTIRQVRWPRVNIAIALQMEMESKAAKIEPLPDHFTGAPTARRFSSVHWLQWSERIWLSIAAILLLRLTSGWYRSFQWVAQSKPYRRLSDPHVRVSTKVPGPVSIGLFHPVVLLPANLVDRLNARQVDQVLAHEFAHARRGDHLTSALQQIILAMLWPHPLIHLLSRRLNQAREALCDNAVLIQHDQTDYAETLLQIAEWIKTAPAGSQAMALSLLGRRLSLDDRIRDLLDDRRILMTRLNRKLMAGQSLFLVAIALAGASIELSCAKSAPSAAVAVAPMAPQPLTAHEIKFEQGDREFYNGDNIQISSVRCTAPRMAKGETIEVRGTYDLQTCSQATLALSVTATDGNGRGAWGNQQSINVKRGRGEFVLSEKLTCQGWPHVSFYAAGGCVDGVYFGEDQWLLKDKPWPNNRKIADAAVAADK